MLADWTLHLRQKVATCPSCAHKEVLEDLEKKVNWSNFLAISIEQGFEINLPYVYLKALLLHRPFFHMFRKYFVLIFFGHFAEVLLRSSLPVKGSRRCHPTHF